MKANSRIATLVFRRADLGFFMEIVGRLPWEVAVKNKRSLLEQCWLTLKDHLFRAHKWSILMCRKASKHGKRPAQVKRELWTKAVQKYFLGVHSQ